MAFTEKHVARFLADRRIFDRALDYAGRGRARVMNASPIQIDGEVRGSSKQIYQTLVALNEGGLHGVCTCPYPLACKHLGALLVTALRQGLVPDAWANAALGGADFDEGDAPDPELKPPPLYGRRDLSRDKPARPAGSLGFRDRQRLRVRPIEAGSAATPGSHVLHLVLTMEMDYGSPMGRRLMVTPKLRYLRRDGAPGALSPWRPSADCVATTSRDLDLLILLDGQEKRMLPLAPLLPGQLVAGGGPDLWLTQPEKRRGGGRDLVRARFEAVASLEIRFFPVRVTGRQVLFRPYLVVRDQDDEGHVVTARLHPDLARWIESGRRRFLVERRIDLLRPYLESPSWWTAVDTGLCFLVDREGGRVFYSTEGVHAELVELLETPAGGELSYPDIVELKARVADLAPASCVRVVLPPTEVEIRPIEPRLIVDVGDGQVRLRSSLGFAAPTQEDLGGEDLLILDFCDNDRRDAALDGLARRCRHLLASLEPEDRSSGSSRTYLCSGSRDEIAAILVEPMLESGVELRVEGRNLRATTLSFALRVTASGEDWFSVSVTAEADGEEVDLGVEGSFAKAKDGTLIVIRNKEDLARFTECLGISGRGTWRMGAGEFDPAVDIDALLAELRKPGAGADAPKALHMLRTSAARRGAWLGLAGRMASLDMPEPPGFGTRLRPYQRYGLAWLEAVCAAGFGPLLADDMGLGKTVQTLALLQARSLAAVSGEAGGGVSNLAPAASAGLAFCLVVAPPATIENWRQEILAFAPALEPSVYHGAGRKDLLSTVLRRGGSTVLITSYQTLLKDVEDLAAVEWGHVVLDEVQTIKNLKTHSYRAARRLSAANRIALSGTPVENSSLELFAIIDLLNPGIFGSRASFIRRFGEPIEREGDPEARRRLRDLLSPIVLRRKKIDVAKDLPTRDEIPLYVSLPPAQRAIYERIRSDYEKRIRDAVEDGQAGRRVFLIIEGLTRLRQAAIDPRLLSVPDGADDGAAVYPTRGRESAKLAAFADLVPQIMEEDHRILVFSQFVTLLSILRRWAESSGYSYCYLDGSMTPARRKKEIARYQTADGPPIFFISLRAGGLGINLTAADYVVLMDPWWNPAVEDQAIDRSHRIGQRRPVTAYRLIASDTVEERIAALQARKRALAADIVPDESALISSLSPQEVMDLFSS